MPVAFLLEAIAQVLAKKAEAGDRVDEGGLDAGGPRRRTAGDIPWAKDVLIVTLEVPQQRL